MDPIRAFDADGPLSVLPGYAVREGQVQMARAVHLDLQLGGVLLVEAPAGTGKSFAYAIPAITRARQTGYPVVIATANIALQEQLVNKDLPRLQKCLPESFSYALIKGRANYLCWLRAKEPIKEHLEDGRSLLRRRRATQRPARAGQIMEWAVKTLTGDKSELPFELTAEEKRLFFMSSDDCPGKACPHYGVCFYEHAKDAARACHLIVVNYHLLFAHYALLEATRGQVEVLPPFRNVVADEGHRLAEVARDFHGFRLTLAGVQRATARLEKIEGPEDDPVVVATSLRKEALRAAKKFFRATAALYQSRGYRYRLRHPGQLEWQILADAMHRCGNYYVTRMDGLSHRDPMSDRDKMEVALLSSAARRCQRFVKHLTKAMQLEDPENFAYYIELPRGEYAGIACKAVHVGEILRKTLLHINRSVVITSATLTLTDGFRYIREETGASEAVEVVVPSPFTSSRRFVLFTPDEALTPKDVKEAGKNYNEEAAQLALRTVRHFGGRTLCLFSSKAGLQRAREAMSAADLPFRVLSQVCAGEPIEGAPRSQLLQEFRDDETSVLLGTVSFWEGVDVPGPALSCVIIDRLPFVPPSDPVYDVRVEYQKERLGAFKEYSTPKALMQFRQGVGRLIRSVVDQGVVVVLDGRIRSSGPVYWQKFRGTIPPHHHTSSWDRAKAFLAKYLEEVEREGEDTDDPCGGTRFLVEPVSAAAGRVAKYCSDNHQERVPGAAETAPGAVQGERP